MRLMFYPHRITFIWNISVPRNITVLMSKTVIAFNIHLMKANPYLLASGR